MKSIDDLECIRQKLQYELDGAKTQAERNVMGQFATPPALAKEIATFAKKNIPARSKVRFLDPAIGTGSFFSALLSTLPSGRFDQALGYEIDAHYGRPAKKLWAKTQLDYQLADFTYQTPPGEREKYNLVICNPPYVRHHHLNDQKNRLQEKALAAANMKLSGLSGLYCYFVALAHPWMKKNGTAIWLLPSEFMDVNYGEAVKEYLLNEVTLLQIHRFDPKDVQFDDALVSSVIVLFKNTKPEENHRVSFTFSGSLERPLYEKSVESSVLAIEKKWTRFPLSDVRLKKHSPKLSDFFEVKRGIATGDNKFFVMPREQIEKRDLPIEQFRAILPSPRYLDTMKVGADKNGFPDLEQQLFVLDCKLPIDEIKCTYPALYAYIKEGVSTGVAERYLCKNRKIWYSQEVRSASKFYCTYIGRTDFDNKNPFRFILNHSKAIVTNSYLILYLKPQFAYQMEKAPELDEQLHRALNNITVKSLLDEGRVYGGGMHKLEPRELANVSASEVARLLQHVAIAH